VIARTKQEAREIILRGVEALLARHGYRKMTMDDLAAEVGIGKGTIYLYFPSKEELVLSHIDAIVERVCRRLEDIARTERPAEQKLHAMLVERVIVRFDAVYPYRNKVGENLAELRTLLFERRKTHFAREAQIISTCLLEGRRAGHLRFQNAAQTALDMVFATNSMLPTNLTNEEFEHRDAVRQAISRIASLVIHGVARTPATTGA
jgi:AcrR family transcriptional regulator